MTDKIYYQDAYKKVLQAKVLRVEGNRVLLDKTIFIPATNTEPADVGKIDGIKISGFKKEGQDIWHILAREGQMKAGDKVNLELNWDKRLMAMKLHSALHLLAGPFDKNFGKRAVAGAIKGSQAYLVFKEELPDVVINEAISQANKDIEKGLAIKSFWDKKKKGFRWTEVDGYPPIPDGGLHVKNTKEIGEIRLVSKETEQNKQKIIIGSGRGQGRP